MRAVSIFAASVAALALGGIVQAQERLPRECRQEIRKLCGGDRSQLRECLREKSSRLSTQCRQDLRELMQSRRGDGAQQQTDVTVTYGSHSRQAIDYFKPSESSETPPLILFIHGGGWRMGDRTQASHAKPQHFVDAGYAYASAGYRVLPDGSVEDQASDIGKAIARLRADADSLGFNAEKIVLMGHSAGAHLAALVATDPIYAGDDFAAIKGVVLLDGAGYDVPANMAAATRQSLQLYQSAFGTDPARQSALSPVTHVGGEDADNWLILHVADRQKSAVQSQQLAKALSAAGADAEVVAVDDTDHRQINVKLGQSGDFATSQIDAFLRKIFAKP